MIIAEISQNFTNLNEAKELIRLAKENGADLMKAQLFDSMALYGEHTPSELSFADARALVEYGEEIGIEVFFSVFDVERVKWCEEIGVKRYKIGARTHNLDLYTAISETNKPCIVSYDPQYDKWGWENGWQVLYCVSEYPARMITFKSGMFEDTGDILGSSDSRGEYHKEYAGFSDHTIGLDAAKIALARGAQIIEKHFSLCHTIGVDGAWSMVPSELQELRRWADICKQVLN